MFEGADHINPAERVTLPGAKPLLRAQGVSYSVHGRQLLSDIELSIAEGRRTMIMGANGAGKSLLLRLLHGLLPPGTGTVMWRGAPLDRAARRNQAMVFQRPVMLRRSVRANLGFALRVRGLKGTARRAREEEALRNAGLEDLAARPARVLSGGEQQRLAIARALACAPEILFLDEPTASLDPASTQWIEAQIIAAHASGVSIVMVTHDRAQAERLGDEIVFMAGGRIAETGRKDQVLSTPRSEAARAWLEGRLHVPS